MHKLRSRGVALGVVLLAGLLGGLGRPSAAQAGGPELPPELARVQAALEKYQDPFVAVHDGYFSTVGCVHYPRPAGPGQMSYPAGGMGVHFLNPQLIGPVPDPMRPPILLYEPVEGKLRLVGAEWFVPLATGIKDRPTAFGQPFEGPMHGHDPLMPRGLHHYDLHVWLWKVNPAGLFSPTNPDVKCDGYGLSLAEDAPGIVPHP
jgi:hypothetical protein